jgi:aspartate racemase
VHLGILAHSTGGAALCFLAYCQEGFRRAGRNEHPDVTLDSTRLLARAAYDVAAGHAAAPTWRGGALSSLVART